MDNLIDLYQPRVKPVTVDEYNAICDSFSASQSIMIHKDLFEAGLDNVIDDDDFIVCIDSDWAKFKEDRGKN